MLSQLLHATRGSQSGHMITMADMVTSRCSCSPGPSKRRIRSCIGRGLDPRSSMLQALCLCTRLSGSACVHARVGDAEDEGLG